MLNLVSDFLKEAETSVISRDKFASENNKNSQFLKIVRKAHLHNGNKKIEQASFEQYIAPADCSVSL